MAKSCDADLSFISLYLISWEFLIFSMFFFWYIYFCIMCHVDFFKFNLFDVPYASCSLIGSFCLLGEIYSLILPKTFPVSLTWVSFLSSIPNLHRFDLFRMSKISWIFCAWNFPNLTFSLTVLLTSPRPYFVFIA